MVIGSFVIFESTEYVEVLEQKSFSRATEFIFFKTLARNSRPAIFDISYCVVYSDPQLTNNQIQIGVASLV
jgi:hypothetical protein